MESGGSVTTGRPKIGSDDNLGVDERAAAFAAIPSSGSPSKTLPACVWFEAFWIPIRVGTRWLRTIARTVTVLR